MNNTFEIKRFGQVLKKDMQENAKKYLMRALTAYGVITVIFLFNQMQYDSFHNAFYRDLMLFSIFLFMGLGCIAASMQMEPMSNKIKRTSFLMLPASSLEKFLSRWLIFTVGYILVSIVAFWCADITRLLVAELRGIDTHLLSLDQLVGKDDWKNGVFYVFRSNTDLITAISFFFLLHSVFTLGATFWEKSSFIKTFSAAVFIITIYSLLIVGVSNLLFDHGFNDFMRALQNQIGLSNTDEQGFFMNLSTVLFFIAAINWILSYCRFRESEIIKRW